MNQFEPDPGLEDRTIEKLVRSGLIRKDATMKQLGWVLRLTAAIVILGAGIFIGAKMFNAAPAEQYSYLLLLHEDESYENGDEGTRFAEYGNWMRNLQQEHIAITGEKLDNAMTMCDKDDAKTEEATASVTGFFMIRVSSKEDAVRIAMESPHVKHGGKIEIREIVNQ